MGVLLEKVLSTPQSYPLTLNALVAGCNQKNNRDPEMDLSEAEVGRALGALREQGLVLSVLREGDRVEKWRTPAREAYGLASERAMAVFAELLLRGPQTRAELRTRASRMRHEISSEEIDAILADFTGRPDPLAVNIGRAPGGRADRYAHTLYPEEEMAALGSGAAPAPAAARPAAAPEAGRLETALEEIAALRARVEALERAVEEIRGGRT